MAEMVFVEIVAVVINRVIADYKAMVVVMDLAVFVLLTALHTVSAAGAREMRPAKLSVAHPKVVRMRTDIRVIT